MIAEIGSVTPAHAVQFGFIIHLFAKIETQLETVVAGMLGSDLGTAVILIGDMNYRQKRQTVLHIHNTLGFDGKGYPEFLDILEAVHKHAKLRNWIAHSIWVKGKRVDSIKPMQLILRSEKPVPLGHHHNEKDYTPKDLEDATRSLAALDTRLVKFIHDSGIWERVQAKINTISSRTARPPG